MIKRILLTLLFCLVFSSQAKAEEPSPFMCRVSIRHPEGGNYTFERWSCSDAWVEAVRSCYKENKDKYNRCFMYREDLVMFW